MAALLFKEESYKIVGLCMEVHKELGIGFREEVYKEALEIEFKNHGIPYERERQYKIDYKGKVLARRYPADFIVFDHIILEVKAKSVIVENFVVQTVNYLKASGLQLGIIANFGQRSFVYKRIVF